MKRLILIALFIAGLAAAFTASRFLLYDRQERYHTEYSTTGHSCSAACCLPANVDLSEEKRAQLVELEKVYCQCKDRLAHEIDRRRMALAALLLQRSPDLQAVDRLVEEIAAMQADLEKETVRHILAIRDRLEPQEREQFIKPIVKEIQRRCYHRKTSRDTAVQIDKDKSKGEGK